jgi:hypothetical protein
MSSIGPTCIPVERFLIFAEDGMQYLWSYSSANPMHQDFTACQSIAKMVLQAAVDRPQLIEILLVSVDILVYRTSNKPHHPLTQQQNHVDLRTWNLILLAAVRQNDSTTRLILGQFRGFTRIYQTTLNQTDNAISRAYIAVKLWILISRRSIASTEEDSNPTGDTAVTENITMMMIWSELWPPLEAVITALEQHGSSSSLMASNYRRASEHNTEYSVIGFNARFNSRLDSIYPPVTDSHFYRTIFTC